MFLTPLKRSLYWSCGLHLVLGLLLLIVPSLLSKTHRFQQEKVVWVSVPFGTTEQPGSIMKKSEGLPQTTIQEQKEALQSKPKGNKKASMTYKPPQKKKKTEKKKTQPTKKTGHPDSKVEDALSRMQKKVAQKKATMEAAQIPEGEEGGYTFGSTNGDRVSPNDPEYIRYQMKVRERILSQRILPSKYENDERELLCRIIVYINEQGEVVKTEWDKKSGDASFDLSSMRAIEKASPLDVPPERLKYEVLNEGFIIEFTPPTN